ncbi:MAG: YybS family protein [Desulfobacterales bacterium]|nr:YybS family protein [Desulfobacterales bacterium]
MLPSVLAFGLGRALAATACVPDTELDGHPFPRASAINLELSLLALPADGRSPRSSFDFLENSLDVIQRVLVGVMPALVSRLDADGDLGQPAHRARRLFQRFRALPFRTMGRWTAGRPPSSLVWAVIAAGVPHARARALGARIAGAERPDCVFMVIYFFQGLAIVAYFFPEEAGAPLGAPAVLHGLIAVQQVVMLAVIGAGFFDTWFNFQKTWKNPLAPKPS